MSTATAINNTPRVLCDVQDLVDDSGVVALHDGRQIALFYLPKGRDRQSGPEVFAIANHDPFSKANVIGRGIVGDKDGEPVVASPIYKQHFRLTDGVCLEDDRVRLDTFNVRIEGERVVID
ncbi:nitrite reductase small subunit NirD [Kushneria indalinina]|uniref:Nitrite reductase (NADH) small subunit n=1 Tax=Kushneria indalinina DSM 14324 TaxID=1122140 RepID=A0A3D9DYB8_9GAMM|nr:nitrite reductase small subunit NirD [Kushneria indalinina]REC95768.1 nitrite reductase (NADH) small subunit [Kushneria indalinina DSM 14324]